MLSEASQHSPPRSRCRGSKGRSGVCSREPWVSVLGGHSTRRRRLQVCSGHVATMVPRFLGGGRPSGEEPGCRAVNTSGGNLLGGTGSLEGAVETWATDSSQLRAGGGGDRPGCTPGMETESRNTRGLGRPPVEDPSGEPHGGYPRLPGSPGSLRGSVLRQLEQRKGSPSPFLKAPVTPPAEGTGWAAPGDGGKGSARPPTDVAPRIGARPRDWSRRSSETASVPRRPVRSSLPPRGDL